MLRDLKSSFLRPRVMGFVGNSDSSTGTLTNGKFDAGAVTSGGTGLVSAPFLYPFARTPIVVASPSSADVASAFHACPTASLSKTTLALSTLNEGSADDGTFYALALGYDSPDQTRTPITLQTVRSSLKRPRVFGLRVDTSSSGSVLKGAYRVSSIVRNGTGDLTINFKEPFAGPDVTAVATAIGSTRCEVGIVSVSRSSVRILRKSAGSAQDGQVNIIVHGSDVNSTTAKFRARVQSPQRKPILEGVVVSYSAGVPSITTNSSWGSVSDDGTGEFTLTFPTQRAFKQEPIVVCTSAVGGFAVVKAAASATAVTIDFYNDSGTLADPGATNLINIIVLGTEDSTEF